MPSLFNKIKALESHPTYGLNTIVALADIKEADIAAMESVLAEKGISIGEFVGAGSTAVIFDLHNAQGKKIDSAVLRIEDKGIAGNSKHPFVLQPVASYYNGELVAHIMPRAEKLSATPSKRSEALTIAALNADGVLQEAWDLKPDALMHMKKPDGSLVLYSDKKPVLVVADSNAVGAVVQNDDMDFASTIARAFDLPEKNVREFKLKRQEIDAVAAQMDDIYSSVRKDIKNAGINVEDRGNWQQRTADKSGRILG